MASLLFKCIPCTRRGKLSLHSEERRASQLRYVATSTPVECQMADIRPQSNAPISHARGFEEVAMGIVDYDTAVQTDTKK
jgi:hypothetical protein